MKVVLSISGGGMRGVIPCALLREIEEETGKPIHQSVDLIAGTSTGGILALLMAAGVPAEKAMDFYFAEGPKIFSQDIFRKLYTGAGLIHTKYRSDNLLAALKKSIGEGLLKDALTKVMVTSLTDMREAVMVKSWNKEWQDLPMALAALLTSAAQTYFPQARIVHNGRETGYLDGGNVRNNPSVCALVEALRLFGTKEPITLVHLGTGIAANRKPLPNGGAAFWAAEIFDATTNGDDSYDDYQCRVIGEVIPNFTYLRLDTVVDAFPAMDDARSSTLATLVHATLHGIEANDTMKQVCDLLKSK